MASGMPWPRIFSVPKRAIRPMTIPPSAGATAIQRLGFTVAKSTGTVETWPRQTRFDASAISLSRTQALATPPRPQTTAMAISVSMRGSAVKSPSLECALCGARRAVAVMRSSKVERYGG